MAVTLIAGVGPGLGAALARRFAAAGDAVALAARTPGVIDDLAAELRQAGGRALPLTYDVTDAAAVAAAVRTVETELGPVDTLLFNAGGGVFKGLVELQPDEFLTALQVGPYGAFLHAQALLPGMARRGGGTVIFTGATSSVRAPTHAPAFAAAKFGLRGLAQSLARAWGKQGVHVAHVLIDGVIRTPRTVARLGADESYLEPDAIAQAYFALREQDPSAWTFELDLRPARDPYLEN